MPVYCYRCRSCGRHTEMSSGSPVPAVPCSCGHDMTRDFRAEHSTVRSGEIGWPMVSEAAGVHPSQIGEARRLISAKAGCDCQFTPDGNPVFTSMSHRRRCLRAMGYEDKLGYY